MPSKPGTGSRKYGRHRRSEKNKRYKLGNKRFKNKLVRVEQSQGAKAAARYSALYRYVQAEKDRLAQGRTPKQATP